LVEVSARGTRGTMMTNSQQRILEQIKAGGYKITKEETIGRKLFIVAVKDRGNVFLDESLVGTVGARGALALEYSQFNYHQPITEEWELRNKTR
jgi:hypothetical protein